MAVLVVLTTTAALFYYAIHRVSKVDSFLSQFAPIKMLSICFTNIHFVILLSSS
jgi:hypothetical protein